MLPYKHLLTNLNNPEQFHDPLLINADDIYTDVQIQFLHLSF